MAGRPGRIVARSQSVTGRRRARCDVPARNAPGGKTRGGNIAVCGCDTPDPRNRWRPDCLL